MWTITHSALAEASIVELVLAVATGLALNGLINLVAMSMYFRLMAEYNGTAYSFSPNFAGALASCVVCGGLLALAIIRREHEADAEAASEAD